MHDLNDLLVPGSDMMIAEVVGINEAGQIIGGGMVNGVEHAILLTPQA
jgi:hypothetical protein